MSQWPQADWRRQIYRASRLDEFLLYLSGTQYDGETEYTAEDFVKRLTSFEESPKMAAGTAVHAVIEHSLLGELPESVTQNGWHVYFELDAEISLPPAREIPLFREHNGIPLFGRVDAIDAHTIHDIKTTAAIDVERYLDSYQWRAYLWMSGRSSFVYDILKVKLDEERREVTVQEYTPLKVSAYPDMARDVEMLLEDYHACIRALGIDDIMAGRKAA